jgi:prepilin-type N-terminal cleavage/methylation domain-containing protein
MTVAPRATSRLARLAGSLASRVRLDRAQERHNRTRRASPPAKRVGARPSGFTLIEIMLAVLIVGLLASAAALSFRQPIRAARAQDAVELIHSFDAGAREVARRFAKPLVLTFDLREGRLERHENEDQATYTALLPHGVHIGQFRTAARRVAEERIDIPCSAAGLTRTYAVRLVGPGVDRWLLVSGFSGDVQAIQDEAQLDAIFAATATQADAASAATDSDDAD